MSRVSEPPDIGLCIYHIARNSCWGHHLARHEELLERCPLVLFLSY